MSSTDPDPDPEPEPEAEPVDDTLLPVHRERQLIVTTVKQSQFVVVSGATGSGKSTQIAQYILDSVFDPDSDLIVAVSQPRRVGAISLARRVAHERQTEVGDQVGYTVRFEDCTSDRTRIRYITDGCLLRELSADPDLSRYGAVVLDEAHERSLQTDILLGLLKQIAARRPSLRIVVTSATLDLQKFSSFCNECPTLSIPGRSYPVQISHIDSMDQHRFYVDAAVELAATVHSMKPLGHILVFLTGQEEIERACDLLGKKIDSLHEDSVAMPDVVILPMYGALSSSGQSRIFQRAPPGCRKIIFASNIAETSLTVPGITYVIDTGYCKQKMFDPHTGIDSLVVTKISRVSATQRAGRAGRTGPGICYRLYSEKDLESFPAETVPEIQRSNLSHTVLLLKEIGVNDPLSFPFLDRPPTNTIENALCHLFYLGGLDADGNLTQLGHAMARLPLDPTLALLLIKSIDRGCAEEMLTIAAMVSSEQLWIMPSKQNSDAAEFAQMQFRSKYGDHISLLFVYDEWVHNDHSQKWAEANYLNGRALQTARMIRRQIKDAIRSSLKKSQKCPEPIDECRKILGEVFFDRCAMRVAEGQYRLYRHAKRLLHNRADLSIFGLHYQSALRLVQPKWVVYGELVAGSQGRPAMRNVTAIEIDWIKHLLPRLNEANISRLTGHRHHHETRSRSRSPQRHLKLPATEPEPTRIRSPSPRTKAARARFAERKKQKVS